MKYQTSSTRLPTTTKSRPKHRQATGDKRSFTALKSRPEERSMGLPQMRTQQSDK
jgi:hypothetical protein